VTEAIEKAGRASAGLFLYGPSTIFDQHAPIMPDEDTARLALRTADQLRTDIANLECGQEFLMQRVNSLPTASDLCRARLAVSVRFDRHEDWCRISRLEAGFGGRR
jgi:hypothetical protein